MTAQRPDTPSDSELVRRAVDGQRDAFEAIYNRYQAIVYRFARAMTGSPTIADDVTQEVFVSVMRDLERYDPQRAGLSTYLYGVARNVTRARLRRERRFTPIEDITVDGLEPASADDPFAMIARARDLARLKTAIIELPPRYRELVILCDLHELSYAQAATVIEIPVGTVRSRLSRAHARLAQRLRPESKPLETDCVARCLA
jgi:RNA polymerase sigma-70 factor, ECF subfamily